MLLTLFVHHSLHIVIYSANTFSINIFTKVYMKHRPTETSFIDLPRLLLISHFNVHENNYKFL